MSQCAEEAEPELTIAANRLIDSRGLLKNRYFEDLVAGRMSCSDFVESQKQFAFAVRFFSRVLAALAARMPNSSMRQVLMHNLAEEHGWDDETGGHFTPSLAHDHTFQAFLASLGVSQEDKPIEGAAVRSFNLALLGACMTEPPELAYAALGIIEYAFADISALIGKAVVDCGWISKDALVHYKLHAAIDKRHAAELFAMSVKCCAQDARQREASLRGLELGCYLFDRLYTDLRAN